MSVFDFDNSNMYNSLQPEGRTNATPYNYEQTPSILDFSCPQAYPKLYKIDAVNSAIVDAAANEEDDDLFWLRELKKHQRDFNISTNYQPYKPEATAYTKAEREQKHPTKTLIK